MYILRIQRILLLNILLCIAPFWGVVPPKISIPETLPLISHTYQALITALHEKDREALQSLIDEGVSLNDQDAEGLTPLMFALLEKYVDAVELLVKAGADIHTPNKQNITPLFCAVVSNLPDMVALLVSKKVALEVKAEGDLSALVHAAEKGYNEVVALLLAAGADTQSRDKKGATALIWAAMNGHASIVEMLIQARADIETSVFDVGGTALFWAAGNGHTPVVPLLLAAGADTEARDSDGVTVLINAAMNGHKDIVALLLDAGADKEASLKEAGGTALFWAAFAGEKEIVRHLLAQGVRTDITAAHGITLLDCALFDQDYSLARTFGSPLSDYALACKAICSHKIQDVRFFIEERKLSVNEADRNGVTLLSVAAYQDKNAFVLYLLSKGANPFLKTNKGWTPLRLARNKNPQSLAAQLIEKKMRELELYAEQQSAQLCAQEIASPLKEHTHKETVRTLLSTERYSQPLIQEEDEHGWTDDDDCDARYMAQYLPSVNQVLSISKIKNLAKKSAPSGTKPLTIDASRGMYDRRVEEWFGHPERALERPEYDRCPETFFPEVIFAHRVARVIDTLTRDWALCEPLGKNKMNARLYCIIVRYGIQQEAILEYGIDTHSAKPIIYHRFLNKLAKHPDIASRFVMPPTVTPSRQARLSAGSPASDGSYIIQKTDYFVEIFDPLNEATIFVLKPKK